MTDKIKVVITDNQKEVKIPTGIRMLVRRCCHAILELENFKGSAEIGITFTNDDEIKEIARACTDAETEAAVIALPDGGTNSATGMKYLGNVVMSMEKAVQNANVYGHTFQREVAYLTAHGLLTIMGYDYSDKDARVEMREKEEWTLYQLGLPASSSYIAHRM